MQQNSKNLYKHVFHGYIQAMKTIELVRQESIDAQATLTDLADTLFVVKQALKLVKELTTQLNTVERLTTQIVCARWMIIDNAGPIRTPYTTVSPDMKMMVKMPNSKSEPEKYKAFCEHFGLTEELINSGCFAPHWPSMVEYISSLAEQGKPLPPHCDPNTTYPVYTATCRKNQDILDAKDLPDKH